jgi:hypothetical protein
MNPRGKKFIALFLAFSLMMLSANLYAKERRGAKLIITKKDGQQISGELITVKPNALLLLDTEGKDVSVDISNIKVIRIVKKSKVWTGAGLGFLICGGGTALYTHLFFKENGEGELKHIFTALLGLIGGAAGALAGGFIGASAGTDKTIQIEGRPDLEIRETLEYLGKKARVPDYLGTKEMPVYRDISIGLYLGYSTMDSGLYKMWHEYAPLPQGGDAWADISYLSGLQVQYFFKNSHAGISFDLFSLPLKERAYFYSGADENWRYRESEDVGFAYFFSFNFDFRVFPNREKNFNPYLSVGYVFLTAEQSNYFKERKLYYWPELTTPIKLGIGLRYKIKDRFFVNSAFYYLPAHKFSSARIGLEYVF